MNIVLLDFGGKRTPDVLEGNLRMLRECTHSILLSKKFDNPDQESAEGMEAWRKDCRDAGLEELAVIHSLWKTGDPAWRDEEGIFTACIRADQEHPTDTLNNGVIEALATRIASLPQPGRIPAYVDLSRFGAWDAHNPYSQMAELVPVLQRLAKSAGRLALGGKTAIFAYLIAMHHALLSNPEAEILFFNPVLAARLVRVPSLTGTSEPAFPYGDLKVGLKHIGGGLELDIRLESTDKFLSPIVAELLEFAPLPKTPLGDEKKVWITGAAPAWLHAAYSRWLMNSGVKEIYLMDKSSDSYIQVFPPEPNT